METSRGQKISLLFFVCISIILTLYSCKGTTEPDDTSNNGTGVLVDVSITGYIKDFTTNDPVSNAVVKITYDTVVAGSTTDASGKYTLTISINAPKDIKVIASKEGYLSDTLRAYALPGRLTEVPTSYIKKTGGTTASGGISSIFLAGQTLSSIGVKESGDPEIAKITFEVRDDQGKPISISSPATVNFSLAASPSGGEYISPAQVKTDYNGQASVNLFSGTKAGVVQILAQINITGGGIIKSKPVSISIHGGLPDQAHFSIAPQVHNFPGWSVYGLIDPITAYVGDKYGNPVKPNTSVYFTTTGGIIQGSILTSASGTGTAALMSASPRPVHPTLGGGFATITATTADETFTKIKDELIILFSGAPVNMDVTPTFFNVPNGGSQTFNYTVADVNNNPMSKGQSVTVEAEGENIKIVGDINLILPDTQSRLWTKFSFTLMDTNDSIKVVKPVNIKISSKGPNGEAYISIRGTAE